MITKRARELRKNSTPAEKVFWEAVRNRRLEGKKFKRQEPIIFEIDGCKRFFIADFYCNEEKLVIELDGKIHENQKDYDQYRDLIINKLGIMVLRFKNEEVLEDLELVLEKIAKFLKYKK